VFSSQHTGRSLEILELILAIFFFLTLHTQYVSVWQQAVIKTGEMVTADMDWVFSILAISPQKTNP
jgi:hypothetical protein